tara:strand:+ start:54 stop:1076 length:1023 start_codon:yes stop_codon:yes gene_type:complete
MVLQSSGAISYSDIKNEFGEPTNKNLGAYRVSQTIGGLSNRPLDTGIPKSGAISFSDFYGKKLNIVVNFWSGGTVTRQQAQTQYNNNNVTVIGGFKGKPAVNSTGWQGGKKIIIHVNKLIGSVVHNTQNSRCALRTGSWIANTDLVIDVGGEGRIWGAGGKGGDGRTNQGTGESGKTGTSALGIQYGGGVTINVAAGGQIHRGFGGGGGGGGGHQSDKGSRRYASGGGGGGGQGYPGGPHGDRGNGGALGGNGTDGSISAAGNGGGGSNNGGEAEGGAGGEGGWTGDPSADAGGGGEDSSGGAGGGNGAAIRRTSGISLGSITINNSGNIDGATNQTGVS